MKSKLLYLVTVFFMGLATATHAAAKEPIEAVYIPLADHYPTIVAFEKYAAEMKEAEFKISRMGSWPALKGKFSAQKADIAMITAPMAMNMYAKNQTFKWVGLIHRNGSALAVNDILGSGLPLDGARSTRLPTKAIAQAFDAAKQAGGTAPIVAVPSLEATHTLVLYKFLKDHGYTLAFGSGDGTALAKAVAPPKSPNFLAAQNARSLPAAFAQSLPWADVVETQGKGRVAWYSKDVLPTDRGHVECVIIANDYAIESKQKALKEVIHYIHKAGQDIQNAIAAGPEALKEIAAMIHKHIPAHSEKAILASLSKDLDVINYHHLNVDKPGLETIMNLAVEAGVLEVPIDLDAFADEQFATEIGNQ